MSKEEITSETCQNCKHWKTNQLGLSYSDRHGYCISPGLEYDMSGEVPSARILDRLNLNDKWLRTHFLKSKKGAPTDNVPIDRYSFVTTDNFGCVNFENKDKEQ